MEAALRVSKAARGSTSQILDGAVSARALRQGRSARRGERKARPEWASSPSWPRP